MSSSRLPHDDLEILIAADALDGLDQADREQLARLMASHGPDCEDCQRLVAEYREVAGRMGLMLEPESLSAGAEDALVAAARTAAPSPLRARRTVGAGRRWIAAVAVAAALAILGGAVGYLLAPGPSRTQAISFPKSDGQQLTVVYQRGQRAALVVGANLQDPGTGRVYELWYQPSPGASMRPAGVFTPTEGSVVASVTVGSSFVALAVTIEPGPDGSHQPTSNPIFSVSV
jgi:hypothetical protein